MINLKPRLRLNFFTLVNNYSSRYYEGMVHKVFKIHQHSLQLDLKKKKKNQANIFVTSRKMLIVSYSSKRVRSGEKT